MHRAQGSRIARRRPIWDHIGLALLYVMWGLIVFDPGQFLDAQLGLQGLFSRLPTALIPLLLIVIVTRLRREAFYWPFTLFLLLQVVALPFVDNRGRTMFAIQCLYPSYFLYLSSVSLVDTPRKCFPILLMFLLSIAWYGVQGLSTGLVSWQTQYDENGYGALMVLGLAFAFPFARAARMTSWRVVAFATAALGIAGSVVSLARGAFLALIAVAAFLWIRSPRKIYGIFAAAAGIIVLLIVVEVRYPGGTFWVEMSTIDDAAEAPEHQERWVINNLALEVFKRYPVFGVGANNFGPVAARTITPDDNRSAYSNPATVWGRTLHNDYLQVLVEQGVVGFVLYAWMIVDFFRRTSAMRRPDLTRRWRTESGGRLELVLLTIGLEAGMIAYLVTALVYPQLYFHWFYTLITLAGTLWAVCKGLPHAQRSAEPLRSARGAGTSEAASPAAGRRTFGDLLADGPNGASRARLYTEDANR